MESRFGAWLQQLTSTDIAALVAAVAIGAYVALRSLSKED
jgi:hypothetical protein